MAVARKLYYENVRVGDELTPVVRPTIDRVTIARYAGAAGDFNSLHVDEDYAKRCGFPSATAHPMLALGWIGQFVGEWLKGGPVKRLSARFVKIIWPGDQLTCRGRVTDKRREGGDYYIDLDVWVENQKGELVLKGVATGKLFYSSEDEERQARGLPALIVDDAVRPSLAEVFEREIARAVAPLPPLPPLPPLAPAEETPAIRRPFEDELDAVSAGADGRSKSRTARKPAR